MDEIERIARDRDLEQLEWERDEALLELDKAHQEISTQFALIKEQELIIRAMAARLDVLEAPVERQNTISAEWRGPVAAYGASSTEINRRIAQEFTKMLQESPNPPVMPYMQRIHADAIESGALEGSEEDPNG